MWPGERRLAQRLEALLEPDYLCWYDIPIGTKRRGFLILEVKDWALDSIERVTKTDATLGKAWKPYRIRHGT
jgi:hypothetical protein